jgi:hypothetical protein
VFFLRLAVENALSVPWLVKFRFSCPTARKYWKYGGFFPGLQAAIEGFVGVDNLTLAERMFIDGLGLEIRTEF